MLDLLKYNAEMPDEEVTPEYLVDHIWIAGGPEDVAGKLRRLYENVGGFGALLDVGHEWEPHDQWIRSVQLRSQQVIPALSNLG